MGPDVYTTLKVQSYVVPVSLDIAPMMCLALKISVIRLRSSLDHLILCAPELGRDSLK